MLLVQEKFYVRVLEFDFNLEQSKGRMMVLGGFMSMKSKTTAHVASSHTASNMHGRLVVLLIFGSNLG